MIVCLRSQHAQRLNNPQLIVVQFQNNVPICKFAKTTVSESQTLHTSLCTRGTFENQYWMSVIFRPSGNVAIKTGITVMEITAWAQEDFQMSVNTVLHTVFQRNYAKPHCFVAEESARVLDWPAVVMDGTCLDISPTENIWHIMKHTTKKTEDFWTDRVLYETRMRLSQRCSNLFSALDCC